MRYRPLRLKLIYEDFNGEIKGVNPLQGTQHTLIANWTGFPFKEGMTIFSIMKLGDSFYLQECFLENSTRRVIVKRVYAIERPGSDLL